MVYAFLISCLGETSEDKDLLFLTTYGQEELPGEQSDNVSLKQLRKEQFKLVTERVQSEYEFQQRTFDIPKFHDGSFFENLPKEDSIQKGVFRLGQQEVFVNDKIVIWQIRHKLAFIVVVEKSENTLQAQTVLKIIVRNIEEHLNLPSQSVDILQKPDKVSSILDVLLPSGRLLFMNSALTKQFERELGQLFQGK